LNNEFYSHTEDYLAWIIIPYDSSDTL